MGCLECLMANSRDRCCLFQLLHLFEGNVHNSRSKSVPKQFSDTHLCTVGFSEEHMLGQNSFKGTGGKPIKKLLAEEMTKESEAKRRSPSIIARLMGLDGLPSPQHGNRQQRKASDKRQQSNASTGSHQSEQSIEGLSSRRSSVDQPEFKDVYEDLEASHVSNRCYSSTWASESRLRNTALEIIQQKAKHPSTSKRLQFSEKSEVTLGVLDFDEDSHLRYLQQHDHHFHYFDPANSSYGHVASSRPLNLVAYAGTAEVWKSERRNETQPDLSSSQKRKDGRLLVARNCHKSCKSCHPVNNRFDSKIEKDVLPTKIVVLKPNLGKQGSLGAPFLSPGSRTHPSSFKKHLVCRTAKADEVEKRTKRNPSYDFSFSKAKCKEDRKLARSVTRQMRENLGPFGHDLVVAAHSGVRGYAGDESSCDTYESDSSSGVEGINISSRNSLDWTNSFKSSPSGPSESSVSKEAKKRLSERWKMAQRSECVQPIETGSTLGEMLAVPDKVVSHEEDLAVDPLCSIENSAGISNCNHQKSPLGISSNDGWKDGCVRNSSRSPSLCRSSYGSRGYNTVGHNEALIDGLVIGEKNNRGRNKSRKGTVGKKENYDRKITKDSTKKPHSHCCKVDDGANPFQDVNLNQTQTENGLNKQGEKEKLILPSGEPALLDSCLGSDVNCKDETFCSGSPVNLYCNQPENMVQDHDLHADDHDVAIQEPLVGQSDESSSPSMCTGQPEYSENSKEADHPSPVSVLGLSFAEDVSFSSDCFETVNAELHELRMQLQLLKMESGSYGETSALLSSDEDVLHSESILNDEGIFTGGESWKSAYIDDVLIYSGLDTIDQDSFLAAWYSPSCPLDPWVFDIVEKHWEDVTVTKLDRKLLYDCMNSALLEAFQGLVDPRPWVRTMWGGFISKWRRQDLKDVLHKFVVEVERRANRERQEKELDGEMNWCVEDGIDVIGKEIEELLVDDLVGEILV